MTTEVVLAFSLFAVVEILLFRLIFLRWIWRRIVEGLETPDEETRMVIGSLGMGIVSQAVQFYLLGCEKEKPEGVPTKVWERAKEYAAEVDAVITKLTNKARHRLMRAESSPVAMKDVILGSILQRFLGAPVGQEGSSETRLQGWR